MQSIPTEGGAQLASAGVRMKPELASQTQGFIFSTLAVPDRNIVMTGQAMNLTNAIDIIFISAK